MKYLSTAAVLLFTLSVLGLTENANAQSRHLTSQNVALGGGGTAYQDLYHANFVNPANLMLNHHKRPKTTVGLAGGIYSNVGGNLLNISTYNSYLTSGQVIEGQVADDMLNQWFGTKNDDVRRLNIDAGVVPLGIVYRSNDWSASVASRVRVLGNSNYSRGFADLVFRGFDANVFSDGRAVNTNQEFMVYNEISAGFARTVFKMDNLLGFAENVRLHVGVAPKLLMAVNYTRLNLNSTLQIQEATAGQLAEIRHDFSYSIETVGDISDQLSEYNRKRQLGENPELGNYLEPTGKDFTSFKGTSVGVDLGATLEMDINNVPFFNLGLFRGDKKLRAGLSITDLGSLKFDDRPRSFEAGQDFIWHGFDYDQDVINEEFDGDEGKYFESVLADSIGNDIYGDFSSNDRSSFSKGLPTMLNFGSQLVLGKLSVMMDLGTGFVDRGTNTSRMHIALGSEYRLFNFIPLRIGYRTGGHSSSTYHAGTGIEFRNYEFSLGAASSSNSKNHGASLGFAWSGLVVHF